MNEYHFEQTKNGVVLTKGNGAAIHAVIPDTYDDQPVCAIGKYAFSGQEQLRSVSLPESLTEIGNHAFYNCTNLEQVSLAHGIRSIGDGAFKNCKKLHHIVQRGMDHLDQLLSDFTEEVTVTIELDEGKTVVLLFPEFDYSFQELLQPRVVRSITYGSGSFYRLCIARTQIDFAQYDKTFSRAIVHDDPETVLTIAFLRLTYPYRLRDEARERYQAYLSEHAQEAVELALHQRDSQRLELLLSLELLEEQVVQQAIPAAAQQDFPEAVSLLMDYRLTHFSGRRRRFSL